MDEKIDKVIALAGNEHRYQYFTLAIIIFLWINCNFISCILPFIEREPLINYTDCKGAFQKEHSYLLKFCSFFSSSGLLSDNRNATVCSLRLFSL